jgi:voltage-gated potassium channel
MESAQKQVTHLDIVTLILSFYVIGALIVDTFFKIPDEVSRLLLMVDNFVCAVFFFDFCWNFYKAESKLKFMRWGWIDLISSIPTVSALRVGRAARIIRLIRILRAFKSTKNIVRLIYRNKTKGTLTTVSLIAILLLIFSSIAILQVETDPASNIKTAEDAIWWSYATITTVGYGDRYPVTTEGRFIAAILMTAGVGLFGTFTAYIASLFVESKEEDKCKEGH